MCRPHGDNNISELGNFVSSLPKGFVSIARYTPRHSPAQSYEFLKFRENMIISREIFLSLQHLAICHFPSPKTLNESALTRYLQSLEKRNHLNDPASGANHGISSPTRTARTTRSSCFFLYYLLGGVASYLTTAAVCGKSLESESKSATPSNIFTLGLSQWIYNVSASLH